MADTRERVFATIVYPESAPADWRDIVDSWHVGAFISPLHDKDVSADGTPKKPHHHVMLFFDGKKNFDTQIKPLFDAIGGVGRENIVSVRGYTRYLCHLDNPEKAQYERADVQAFGGLSYDLEIQSPSDEQQTLKDMQEFVRKNMIVSFADFADYCADNNDVWYKLLTDKKTYYFTKYMKSIEYSTRMKIDRETGEILDE